MISIIKLINITSYTVVIFVCEWLEHMKPTFGKFPVLNTVSVLYGPAMEI